MLSIRIAPACAQARERTTRDARWPWMLSALLLSAGAHAGTVQVNNLLDSGTGSLRDAIALANAGDDIVFAPGLSGTVHLASRLLMDKSLHVIGYGITLDGGDSVKTINVQNSAQVTLDGLEIQHGHGNLGGGIVVAVGSLVMNDGYVHDNVADSEGGGINFSLGDLVLNNTRVENNVSKGTGGGIAASVGASGGTARINHSLIAGNQAGTNGGGISHFSGVLIISDSDITGNTVNADFGYGGGIHSENAALTLRDSTVSSNRAYYSGGIHVLRSTSTPTTLVLERSLVSSNTAINYGGGVTVFSAAMTSTNSTIAHNFSGAYGGGGIELHSSLFTAAAALTNTTVAFNRAVSSEGGIDVDGNLTLKNCLVAGNVAPSDPDLNGTFTSQGYNLVQTRGSSTGYVASDLPNGSNAGLGALSYNGGPTLTLPISGAALNAVPVANCSAREDQRGYRRPSGNCDIGAFEVEGVVALFADGFE